MKDEKWKAQGLLQSEVQDSSFIPHPSSFPSARTAIFRSRSVYIYVSIRAGRLSAGRAESIRWGKVLASECPDIEILAAYADRNLEPDEQKVLEAHLVKCHVCRKTIISIFEIKRAISGPQDGDLTTS